MRSTFKVLFYVKKGSEKPNGNLPLMCRITVDGEIKQFSCKMDVPLRLWDVKNNRASGKSVEAQKINLAVDKNSCGGKPPLSRADADGRVCYRRQVERYLSRYRCQAGNLAEAVRTAQRRVCQESRTQQGAGDIHPLSDGLQPYPGIPTPYLQA